MMARFGPKPTPIVIRQVTNKALDEFSWLVGLLEGEGSFNSFATGLNRKKRPYIHVTSTDNDVVRYAATLLNGKVHGPYHYIAKNKPYWKTQLSGQKAIDLMLQMLPHFSLRRQEQIRKILGDYGQVTI